MRSISVSPRDGQWFSQSRVDHRSKTPPCRSGRSSCRWEHPSHIPAFTAIRDCSVNLRMRRLAPEHYHAVHPASIPAKTGATKFRNRAGTYPTTPRTGISCGRPMAKYRRAGLRSGTHGGARARRGYHLNPRNQQTPTTRTGVSCGHPMGGARRGYNHHLRLPRLRSGTHSVTRRAGPRSGTHGGARARRGYHLNPRNQQTPTTTRTGVSCGRPMGGAGRGYDHHLRLPRLRSGTTPPFVVPDSDPVPTVGQTSRIQCFR